MSPVADRVAALSNDAIRQQLTNRSSPRTADWLMRDARRRAMHEDALDAMRDWCLEHLSSEKPYGGVCIIRSGETVEVRGRAYDNDIIAYQQAGARRTRLAKKGVAAAAICIEAKAATTGDESIWHMHVKQREPYGEGGTGRTYPRSGTPAEHWELAPRISFWT